MGSTMANLGVERWNHEGSLSQSQLVVTVRKQKNCLKETSEVSEPTQTLTTTAVFMESWIIQRWTVTPTTLIDDPRKPSLAPFPEPSS